jgi:peptide/nickel transport system ATP-binding protein
MTLLSICNLRTHFLTQDGLVKAVDSVSLDMGNREKLGLIGETGCGKTVLGMSIIRLLQPTTKIEGKIFYKGRDILQISERDMQKLRGREIAMILQNPTTSLNPVLKVGEQIAEAIQLHQGVGRRESWVKALDMLEAVKIPDAAKRAEQYPHELSGGMRERAMIAMGLACDPSFIIADEPTKGLDQKTKAQIVTLMRETTEDKSMMIITHDLGVAGEICDRIAVMYAGEILELSGTKEIFESPMHPYTQGFINSLPSRGLQPIPGMSPSLIDPPEGCRFHPRCSWAKDACKKMHPELVSNGRIHSVRCHLCA